MMFALTVVEMFFLTLHENKGLLSAYVSALQLFKNQYITYFTIYHNNVLRALNAMLIVVLNWWAIQAGVDGLIIIFLLNFIIIIS